jgi:hypothetical protein
MPMAEDDKKKLDVRSDQEKEAAGPESGINPQLDSRGQLAVNIKQGA